MDKLLSDDEWKKFLCSLSQMYKLLVCDYTLEQFVSGGINN